MALHFMPFTDIKNKKQIYSAHKTKIYADVASSRESFISLG